MGKTTKYWASTMFRGVAAILAGTGVVFLPHMVSSELCAPIATSVAMLCLAAFACIDGAILSHTAWTAAESRRERLALRTQGVGGVLLGASLFWMVYSQMTLRWFLAAAALQAILAAASSWAVADQAAAASRCIVCRLSTLFAAVCAASLLLGALLAKPAGSWLIDGYLCFYGLNLMVLSITMLSGEGAASRLTNSFDLDNAVVH